MVTRILILVLIQNYSYSAKGLSSVSALNEIPRNPKKEALNDEDHLNGGARVGWLDAEYVAERENER